MGVSGSPRPYNSEAFAERVKAKSSSDFFHREGRGWAPTQAGPQPAGDALQPPAGIFAVFASMLGRPQDPNHLPILPLTLHFEITNPSSSSLGHYAPSPLCPGPISPWTCPVDSHVSHCCFSPTPPDSDMRPHCLLSLFHPTWL